MDFRKRLIAPLMRTDESGAIGQPDVAALFEWLLLYDKYVLESIRLQEFGPLVNALGPDAVVQLIQSDAIGIYCHAIAIAQIGQTDVASRRTKGQLPLLSYSLARFTPSDRPTYISQCLDGMHIANSIGTGRLRQLRDGIVERLMPVPDDLGKLRLEQTQSDLEHNVPAVQTAVALSLTKKVLYAVRPDDFMLRVHRVDDTDFQVETDVPERFGFDEMATHKVIERALLAVGETNKRLELMRQYEALSGFQQPDLPVFDAKLDFLIQYLDPDQQVQRFRRVATLADVPDLSAAISSRQLDIQRFLEIRNTRECEEFRAWLATTSSQTDEEIVEQFRPLRDRLSGFAHGTRGRVVRLAASSLIGLIPGIGPLLGAGFGALDSFVLNRVLPEAGPTSFITTLYPSIFEVGETA